MEEDSVPDELDPSSIDTFYEAIGHIRDALIRHVGDDFLTQKQIVMEVFNSLDVDQDRVLTATELAEFMRSPELGLLDQIDAPEAENYATLFVGYIDRNKNGIISFQELYDFMFPHKPASPAPPVTAPVEDTHKDNERQSPLHIEGARVESSSSPATQATADIAVSEHTGASVAQPNTAVVRKSPTEGVSIEAKTIQDADSASSLDTFYEAIGHIRDALIRHVGDDFLTQKQIVMEVFNSLDVDQDRVLTATELAEFMRSPELGLLDQIDAPEAENYATLFVGYIDRNKNGIISFQELYDFMFPHKPATPAEDSHKHDERQSPLPIEGARVESSSSPATQATADIAVSEHTGASVAQPNTAVVRKSPTEGVSIEPKTTQEADTVCKPAEHHDAVASALAVIEEDTEGAAHPPPDASTHTPHVKRGFSAELSPASSFQGSVLSLEGMDNITSPTLHKANKSPYGRHTLKASKNSLHNMSSNSIQSGFSSSTYHNLASASAPGVVSTYATSYNKLVQRLREKLFLLATDGDTEFENYSRKFILTNLFQIIDDNDSGVVTKEELESFLTSVQLDLFSDPADPTNQKFLSLIMEQIDAHRDGNIGIEELEDFLWPKTASSKIGSASSNVAASTTEPRYESGIVIDLTRKALLHVLGAAAAQGPEEILAEFAKMSKSGWKRGKQIDSRTTRKALQHVFISEFQRVLNDHEIDMLMKSLDQNNDGVVSGREFMTWLIPSSGIDEKSVLANELKRLVIERFAGDVRRMFEAFKSYGADVIYKADFVTNLRALDSNLSRQVVQEIVSALCPHHEKSITYTKLTDFVGTIQPTVSRFGSADFDEGLDENVHAIETQASYDGAPSSPAGPRTPSPTKTADPKLTKEELEEARALIAKHKAESQTKRADLTASLEVDKSSASMMGTGVLDAHAAELELRRQRQARLTAGLNSQQLIALGYFRHTGRWRGFPFDSFSCCDTADFICPNSNKFLPDAKGSDKRGFMVSQRLSQSSFASSGTLDTKRKFVLKKPTPSAPRKVDSSYAAGMATSRSADSTMHRGARPMQKKPAAAVSSKMSTKAEVNATHSSYEEALKSLQKDFQQFKDHSLSMQQKLASRLEQSESINASLSKEVSSLRRSASKPLHPPHHVATTTGSPPRASRSMSPTHSAAKPRPEVAVDLAVPWIPSSSNARSPSFNRIYFSAFPKHLNPQLKQQGRGQSSSPLRATSPPTSRQKPPLPRKTAAEDEDVSATVLINGQVVKQYNPHSPGNKDQLSHTLSGNMMVSPTTPRDGDFFRQKSFDYYASAEEKFIANEEAIYQKMFASQDDDLILELPSDQKVAKL